MDTGENLVETFNENSKLGNELKITNLDYINKFEIQFKDVKRVWSWSRSEGTEFKYPEKGSKYAAGYDFYYNDIEPVTIQPRQIEYVKTGIKAKFPESMALLLLNRSSNPKKKNLVLANGIGLVDADYYNNEDNEGEIAFAFMNISTEPVTISYGDKLGQGMFINYYDITGYDSEIVGEREGGFGSTDKEK